MSSQGWDGFTAFGIAAHSRCPVDDNNGIVFKGCQIHGINGRRCLIPGSGCGIS